MAHKLPAGALTPSPSTDIDVEAISIKLSGATAIIDALYAVKNTGDIEYLRKDTLEDSLCIALSMIDEARELLMPPMNTEGGRG